MLQNKRMLLEFPTLFHKSLIFLLSISSSRFIKHPRYSSYNLNNDIALINNSFNIGIEISCDINHMISRISNSNLEFESEPFSQILKFII